MTVNIQKLDQSTSFSPSWLGGGGAWIRVIHALIYRETKTAWGQNSLGIVWAFVEPLTHILILGMLRSFFMRNNASNDFNIFLFVASGIFPFFIFRSTLNKIKSCIAANRALLVFPQITPLNIALSRALLELSTGATAFFLFVFALWWMGYGGVTHITPIMVGSLLMWIFGIGIGLCLVAFHNSFKVIDQLISITIRALYFASGVMFSFTDLPSEYKEYLSYIPTFHGIEYVRSGFSFIYGEAANITYLAYFAFGSLALGLLLLNKSKYYILRKAG